MDAPIRGKREGICVHRDRYRCYACGKKFYYRPPEMYQVPEDRKKEADGKRDEMSQQHEITFALRGWIWQQSLRRNFHDVAYDVGLHDRTVRKIFRAEFERDEARRPKPPEEQISIGL